jgi:protein-glutamine gamma-glutamyltransferase
MITIGGMPASVAAGGMDWAESQVYEQKQRSPITYAYSSESELRFELALRSQIVKASRGLYQSGVGFASFKNSRCNERLWILTAEGGFRLRPEVPPSLAIRDIFTNGRLYAFECATAIVIVLYKALLDVLGEELFNHRFGQLFLFAWQYDSDLRLVIEKDARESYLGDLIYFKNPEFNPSTPEWQGENTIKLGDSTYYGHGIGITTPDNIIASLNTNRKPGATVSAYQMNDAIHPDFQALFQLSGQAAGVSTNYPEARSPLYSKIGHLMYLIS